MSSKSISSCEQATVLRLIMQHVTVAQVAQLYRPRRFFNSVKVCTGGWAGEKDLRKHKKIALSTSQMWPLYMHVF